MGRAHSRVFAYALALTVALLSGSFVLVGAGKKMLGGGVGIFWSDTSGAQRPKVISSFMYQGGWYGEAESSNAQSWSLEVQVVCANVN